MAISRQWFLVSRPSGPAAAENVRLTDVELPDLAAGEVRVQNEILSVDPYMRGRMDEGHSYVPPFALGEALTGAAIGRVVASRAPELAEGTLVQHGAGWRDVAQGPASEFTPLPARDDIQTSWHLGILSTGFTAWIALHAAAPMKEGDIVFISGAAGAVGSVAGQLARRGGASRVIGSAGTDEKAARAVERFGYDTVFNYRSGPVLDLLGQAAPEGIDVYVDNVGGDHLEAALYHARDNGRFAQVGSISGYDGAPDNGQAVRYTWNIVRRGLNLHGFTGGRFQHLRGQFLDDVLEPVARGEIVSDETYVDGLENTFDAFMGLFTGKNTGKMLVRL